MPDPAPPAAATPTATPSATPSTTPSATAHSLADAVLQACALHPARPAVSDADSSLSYAELERSSRHLAGVLHAAGLRRGDRVGVWAPKSPAAVSALLGVLRAGGVYVPLDSGSPAARIEMLAANCGLFGLFGGERELALAAGFKARPQFLGALARPTPQGEALPPASGRGGRDLAYILYTSGSTGTPKGVMLSHAHAVGFVRWAAAEVALAPGDRVASHAPFHFDLSIFDVWATLSRGAELVLMDRATTRLPAAAAGFISERRITVWYSVPSALVQMLPHRALAAQGGGPRAIIFAGEVFPPRALALWRAALPRASFHNWYGPTETNVCASFRLPPVLSAGGEAAPLNPPPTDPPTVPLIDPLPLGRACAGFELALRPSPGAAPAGEGGEGELWATGPGLLRGYWGDRARTRAVLRRRGGRLWYNTGDRVRRAASGELYYLGRADGLVKLRGYRVSLLEVERALEQLPFVRQAVAVALDGANQPAGSSAQAQRLVAWVVAARGEPPPESGTLRRLLGERLPSYMVPEVIEVGMELPLTTSGKIDRQRLAGLASGSLAAAAKSAAPRTGAA